MKYRFMWLLPLLFFQAGCGEKIEPGTTSQTPPVVQNVVVETAAMKECPGPLRGRRHGPGRRNHPSVQQADGNH